ncbi:hypothetical protein AVEN_130248-1 [Araneus ventricosus]|uniref:Uncharacterized protein n=1 Tax=Araneus ventricosus TaxID=182803 RepID=A0A4Y2LP14_ARAVE|nr:hypothetical protein AVEN_54991-1 [Araneus ventricosus]GBN15298.1 hypothetical protein AVEN_67302-1 [Araneus ventricosus]GBN15306.1 hypothetical protein AVEN_75039-1 [Araneus ventricosus]GBN18425.1 hypothetical protein AVEN_130248-1 [Araneus ventricosus]
MEPKVPFFFYANFVSAPLIPRGTFYPPVVSHKLHLIVCLSPGITTSRENRIKRASCDGHFQSITQFDDRRVDKGTVITQPPSFVLQRECESVYLVSDKIAKR